MPSPIAKLLDQIGTRYLTASDYPKAQAAFTQLLQRQPRSLRALMHLAQTQEAQGNLDQAKSTYQHLLDLFPQTASAHINLGIIHAQQGDITQAQHHFRQATQIDPQNPLGFNNLANLLKASGDLNQAAEYYLKAIELDFQNPSFYYNLGNIFQSQGRLEEALQQFQQALNLDPHDPEIHNNLGITYFRLQNFIPAQNHFRQALKLDPNSSNALANLINLNLQINHWPSLNQHLKRLDQLIKQELQSGLLPGITPFMSLTFDPNPEHNLRIAQAHSQHLSLSLQELKKSLNFTYKPHSGRIKIAYLSNGFCDFPTAHNLVGVLENHDRTKFEIFAYSFSPDDHSSYRQRIEAAVDHFIDVTHQDIKTTAQTINQDQIDLLIDLKGHTDGNRQGILALRPAPIQISYLGFVGSTGADFIDYLIADDTVIPPAHQHFYSESLILMPDTYWPTDNQAPISPKRFTRSQFGLPEKAFVFGSFHHPYKLNLKIFKLWAQILKAVPNSVLWQYQNNPLSVENLNHEFSRQGLDPNRLIFAPRLDKPDHLARLNLVDLNLDSFPINGHTTTSDSLWAGVPVITVKGRHFASLVSSSILQAAGLSQLITPNFKKYQQLAINLARHPQKLKHLRHQIKNQVKQSPLFNTTEYTRNLERAYQEVYSLYRQQYPNQNGLQT